MTGRRREKARAVLLAATVVLSMVAASATFAGGAGASGHAPGPDACPVDPDVAVSAGQDAMGDQSESGDIDLTGTNDDVDGNVTTQGDGDIDITGTSVTGRVEAAGGIGTLTNTNVGGKVSASGGDIGGAITSSEVGGNVTTTPGSDGDIDVTASTIAGTVEADGSIGTVTNAVVGGTVRANGGDIGGSVDSTEIGGDLITGPGSDGDIDVTGSTVVCGDVDADGNVGRISDSTVGGDVDADGNVHIKDGSTVFGDVTSGGTVTVGSTATVKGDVSAGGDVTVDGTVEGRVRADGTVGGSGLTLSVDRENSSVTPDPVRGGTTSEFELNVSVTHPKLDGDSGQLVVSSELFGDDPVLSYASGDITNGRLTLSKNLTTEAPTKPGETQVPVFVTDVRRDDSDDLLTGAEKRATDVTITDSQGRESLNITVTSGSSTFQSGDTVQFNVTDESGAPVSGMPVDHPGIDAENATATGSNGLVSYTVTTTGQLTAVADPSLEAGGGPDLAPDSVAFTVEEPTLGVNRSSLDLGDVPVDGSGTARLEITNDASTATRLETLSVTGPGSGAFGVDGADAGDEIAANTDRVVDVTFRPLQGGDLNATLLVNDNEVSLDGTGNRPGISVDEQSLEVTSTHNETVRVSNDGTADLNASLDASGETDLFTRNRTDWVNVSVGGTETIEVGFTGERSSGFQELRLVPQTTGVREVRIPVDGEVRDRDVSLGQSDLDFGDVTTGDPTTRGVRVENDGTTTETLNATTTQTENFTLAADDRGTFTLAGGEGTLLTVEANLSGSGEATGTLTVANESDSQDVPNSTLTLRATAQAPDIDVTNTAVTFGDTPQGATATRKVAVENDGERALSAELTGSFDQPGRQNFTVVGDGSLSVPAGASRNVTVGATPRTTGTVAGTLTIADTNDPDVSELDVTLEVNGTTSRLSDNRSDTVDFGEVGVDGTATETVAVSTPSGSVLADSVTATGEFDVVSLTESVPIISDGTDVAVALDSPSTNGTLTGALEIDSDGDGEADYSKALRATARFGELDINRSVVGTGVARAGQETSTGTVTVRNPVSDTTVTVDEIAVEGSPFSLDTSAGIGNGTVIAGQDSASIAVDFEPGTAGEQRGTVTVDATSGDGERTFNRTLGVLGFGSGPDPALVDDTVSVGTVERGESVRETLTVANDGGEAFTVDSVAGTAPVANTTVVDGGLTRPGPGGETDVRLVVEPSSTGAIDADVTVTTSDGTDLQATVTGEAVAPELDESRLGAVDFGDTAVGDTSQREVELNNTGNATLVVDRPTLSGADPAEFRLLSGNQTLRVGAQSSRTITVGFAPDATGDSTATLTVDPLNGDTQTQTVSLDGTGTTGPADVTRNRSFLTFGRVPPDAVRTETLELANSGSTGLEVTGSSITGADSSAFSVDGSVPTVLSPGETTTVTVELDTTGTSRGGLSGRLEVTTNTTAVTSSLGGTHASPEIETTSGVGADEFGTTRLGETSTATVRVNNTGNAGLNLTDLSVAGANASAFDITGPADGQTNTTIGAESSGTVAVEFDPVAADSAVSNAQNSRFVADANLTIDSDDPEPSDRPLTVDLSGRAETAALDAPSTYRFGSTPVGQTTTAQVELENRPAATAPLNITDVSVSRPDSTDFEVELDGSTATPHTLTAGESVDLNVSLTPTSGGRKATTVTVETNDTRQPAAKIGVSNTETTYEVDYGSVNVAYRNPEPGRTEPTVDVDRGFRGRNATLATVDSNVSTSADYALNYTFNSTAETTLSESDSAEASALQYFNATTTAARENFSESTLQVKLSKGALGSVDPGNATIYHDDSGDGRYDPLDTTVAYEAKQGYVYEATAENYSVFAIAVEQEEEGENGDDGDGDGDDGDTDGDDSEADGGGGGGGGGGSLDGPQLQLYPGITGRPDGERVVDGITNEDSLVEGKTMNFERSDRLEVVEQLSLLDDDLGGEDSATVREYRTPPDGVGADIASDLSGVERVAVSRVVEVDIDWGLNTLPSDVPARVPGTVTLSVPQSDLREPSAGVVTYRGADGRWTRAETRLVDRTDGTVTLEATVGATAVVAVSEPREAQAPELTDTPAAPTGETDAGDAGDAGRLGTSQFLPQTETPARVEETTRTGTDGTTPTEVRGGFQFGFGMAGVVLSPVIVALWFVRRRY